MTKLTDLNPGDKVYLDAGFTCVSEGPQTVFATEKGRLYFPCSEGKHFIDGQEDENGLLVGVKKL